MRFLLDNFFLFSIFVIFLFYFFRGELGQLTRTVSQSFSSIQCQLLLDQLKGSSCVCTHTHTHICCVSHKERHKTRSNVTYTSDGRFKRATFKNEKLIIRVTFGLQLFSCFCLKKEIKSPHLVCCTSPKSTAHQPSGGETGGTARHNGSVKSLSRFLSLFFYSILSISIPTPTTLLVVGEGGGPVGADDHCPAQQLGKETFFE